MSEVIFDPDFNGLVQTLSVFDTSAQAPYISERISANFSVMEPQVELEVREVQDFYPEQIIKSDISQEGFIYVLQHNNHMVVYEAFDYYSIITLTHAFTKRWEQDFSDEVGSNTTIHDFDILEGSYILLYTGDNQTLVYQIEMQIYWTYRMVFPLFQQYQNYTYYSTSKGHFGQRRIVRSAYSNYLAILMSDEQSGNNQGEESFQLFFY